MTDTKPQPAEVWPVATFLMQEMEARGWSVVDVAARSDGYLADETVQSILDGHPLTRGMADGLGLAFGTSAAYWRNLDAAYWAGIRRELERSTDDD